jgi:ribonuclease PH
MKEFVEVQGTGEKATFTDAELTAMLTLARRGIARLTAIQREAIGDEWPFG